MSGEALSNTSSSSAEPSTSYAHHNTTMNSAAPAPSAHPPNPVYLHQRQQQVTPHLMHSVYPMQLLQQAHHHHQQQQAQMDFEYGLPPSARDYTKPSVYFPFFSIFLAFLSTS